MPCLDALDAINCPRNVLAREEIAVARSTERLPIVHKRSVIHGFLVACDENGRICWDSTSRERIVLLHDLRIYGAGLHIGQLGWTVPGTTDGYTCVKVIFETGQTLIVRSYALARVPVDTATEMSQQLIAQWRNTRFDADPLIAHKKREEWIDATYGKYISRKEATLLGAGDQELYAFTFPSLREIAALKGQSQYPVKIGYSSNASSGTFGRIKQQIMELAGYPELPLLLCIYRSWDAHALERQVHKALRDLGRKATTSLGIEWYLTTKDELLTLLEQCKHAPHPPDRKVIGADETLEEGFSALLAQGAKLVFSMDPRSARIGLHISAPERSESTGKNTTSD